jgi:hypothetical protein
MDLLVILECIPFLKICIVNSLEIRMKYIRNFYNSNFTYNAVPKDWNSSYSDTILFSTSMSTGVSRKSEIMGRIGGLAQLLCYICPPFTPTPTLKRSCLSKRTSWIVCCVPSLYVVIIRCCKCLLTACGSRLIEHSADKTVLHSMYLK